MDSRPTQREQSSLVDGGSVIAMTGRAKLATLIAAGLLAASCSSDNFESAFDDDRGDPNGNGAPKLPAQVVMSPVTGASGVTPDSLVVIRSEHGKLDKVMVTNPAGKQVRGMISGDRTAWRSSERLGYASTYMVNATARGEDGKEKTTTGTFTTVRPPALAGISVFPGPSMRTVGVGQPIAVTFDEPVTAKAAAERSLVVTTSPNTIGAWHWMSDKEVRWRPQKYWRPGTKVTVNVRTYGKRLGAGIYGGPDRSISFAIHDSWSAIGNVNNHTLAIFHNGRPVRTFPASFGRPKYPTHNGVHVVLEKHQLYYMNSASYGLPANSPDGYSNFPAYWATRISWGGEFIHANDGTTYAQGNTNVSHGCINLTSQRAKWFYDHFNSGDIVQIVGGSPQLPVWDGYGDWNMSWPEWLSGSALR